MSTPIGDAGRVWLADRNLSGAVKPIGKAEGRALFRLIGETVNQAEADIAAAVLSGEKVFADTTAGLAGTANGGFFFVPVTDGLELFKDNAGTAVSQGVVPKTSYLDAAVGALDGVYTTSGELLTDDLFAAGELGGGSAWIGTPPRARGWTIPDGSTGNATYILPEILIDEALSRSWAGQEVRVTIIATATAGYLTDHNFLPLGVNVTDRDGTLHASAGTRTALTQDGTVIRHVYALDWTGEERKLAPLLYSVSAETDGVWSYEIASLTVHLAPAAAQSLTMTDLMLAASLDRVAKAALFEGVAADPARSVRVGPNEAVMAIEDAQDLLADASASRRGELLFTGMVTDKNVFRRDWADWVGLSPFTCGISVRNPDNVDVASTVSDTACWDNDNGALRNLTIEGENCRYALHSDGSNGAPYTVGVPAKPQYRNTMRFRENLIITHHGNAGALAYQIALGGGGNPGGVWPNATAHGGGSSSGQIEYWRGCVLTAPFVAWSRHDHLDFDRPAIDVLECQVLTSTDLGRSIGVQSYGSGLVSLVVVIGSQLNGDVHLDCGRSADPDVGGLWMPTDLAKQPSDMNGHHLYGYGNTPAVFTLFHHGRALKIESAATSGASTVSVSGTAAALIFGDVVEKPGAGGLKGYCYGRADISGMPVGPDKTGTSNLDGVSQLGKRLGDCSSVSKTLSVVVDGGSPIVVTFNANHTAQSNATVLGIINAALGAAATASEYNVGGRYRPRFTDEERTIKNTSAVGIPMGSVLAYDTTQTAPLRAVRLMTSADAAGLFAGVAWEDIYPGKVGRVKTRGWLSIGDVLRDDATAVSYGTTFSISASAPGKVVVGGSQGLLRAIRGGGDAAAVEVRP